MWLSARKILVESWSSDKRISKHSLSLSVRSGNVTYGIHLQGFANGVTAIIVMLRTSGCVLIQP